MQEDLTTKKINYTWIELAPLLVVLLLVVIGLSIIPNCQDKNNCVVYPVGQNIDIEKLSQLQLTIWTDSLELTEKLSVTDVADNLFSMTNVEKP